MKRKHTLRSLLSMVCTIAMILSLVPVLPAAAAEEDVLFDNMESYTVGADLYTQAADKYTQKSPSWNAVKDAGGSATVVADPKNSSNKVVAVTSPAGDSKRYVLATAPELNGDYTLQFDYMPGDAEGNPNSGFIDVYINSGNTHMARIGSALYNTYFNLDKAVCSNVVNNAALNLKNKWYSVRVVVTADQYVMDIWEKGKESTMLTCTTTKGTKAIEKAHVEFCIGPYLESQQVGDTSKPITNYIDNIRITYGVVEASDPDEGSSDVSVSGGGMVEFVDEYIIQNKEAVAVTAGMGIFAGKGDNRFDPEGLLTRAEMATVIVKMLRGNAFDAESFKGVALFDDVAGYQGGWAEGWVNACAQMGIVAGYGDGTFGPGDHITTAQAVTMIINALKVKVDSNEKWPTPYMVKAMEMKLYGDLETTPGTNDILTRDQLAVLVYEGLCYSPSGTTGWEVEGMDTIFTSYAEAKAFGNPTEVKGEDSLASKVYEMKIAEGYIVANQDTSDNKYTTVQTVENGVLGGEVKFNMQTALDEIGHYVTVYYREDWGGDADPGVVYNYVDQTETITVEKPLTAKDYKDVFYEKFDAADKVAHFNKDYTWADNYGSLGAKYAAGTKAAAGTYFIYDGEIVGYMEPVPVYAAQVEAVNNYEDSETIVLKDVASIENNEEKDYVREYKGIAKDDYVTYTKVGSGEDAIYVLTKAAEVKGSVTKQTTNKDGDDVITVNGVEYVQFAGPCADPESDNEQNQIRDFWVADNDEYRTKKFVDNTWSGTYVFYLTEDSKYIGFEESEDTLGMDQTVFILGQVHIDTKDKYSQSIRKTYARGVDMSGNEVMLLVSVQKNGKVLASGAFNDSDKPEDNIWDSSYEEVFNFDLPEKAFYTYELSTETEAKKEGIYKLDQISFIYDEETDPIYAFNQAYANNVKMTFNGGTYDGKLTYASTSVVCMTLEGSKNQDEPLVGTVQKLWSTHTNTSGATQNYYFLFSRNDEGGQIMEAVILLAEELKAAGTVVYVSQEALESSGSDSNGYVYHVYDYMTGAKKDITVSYASGEIESTGYWHVVPEEDGTAYILDGKVNDTGSFAYNAEESDTVSKDKLYNENILHNQVMSDFNNNQLWTVYTDGGKGMTRGQKANTAVVIDLRSEEQIKSDGVGKITSVDRIFNLTQSNPEISVVFDMCYSLTSSKMLTMFVTDTTFASTEDTTVVPSGNTYKVDGREVDVENKNYTFTDLTGNLDGIDELYAWSDDGKTIEFDYEVEDGKITAITVTHILRPGELFHEDFDGYTSGGEHEDHLNTAFVVNNVKGDAKFDIETEGDGKALKVSVTGAATDNHRSWLDTSKKFEGSYTVRARVKTNVDGSITGIYLSNVVFPNIKAGKESTIKYDLRFRSNKYIAPELNMPTDINILTHNGAAETEAAMYLYTEGTDVSKNAHGTKVTYDSSKWYVVTIAVDADAKTVTTKVYDGTNLTEFDDDLTDADLLGSRVMYGAKISSGPVSIESLGADKKTTTAIWDYVLVTKGADPAFDSYKVTAAKADGGVIDLLSKRTASPGEKFTVKVYPDDGYKLVSLKANGEPVPHDDSDLSNVITKEYTMVNEAVTFTAEFTPIQYSKVTVANDKPEEGTISVSGADNYDSVVEGTELTIVPTPADNYAIKTVKVNGSTDDVTEDGGIYYYTVPATGVELVITAEFDRKYIVTVADPENGTADVDKEGAVYGGIVTVTADPDEYYEVDTITVTKVGGGTVDVNENGEFAMPEDDVTVTVTFKRMTYTLTTVVNDDEFGTVTPGGTKNAGETVTLTLTANAGYEAKYVLVNGVKKAITDDGTYDLVVSDKTATTVTAVFWPEGAVVYDDFGEYDEGEFTSYGAGNTWGARPRYENRGATATHTIESVEGRGQVLKLYTKGSSTTGTNNGTQNVSFKTTDKCTGNYTIKADVKIDHEDNGYYCSAILMKEMGVNFVVQPDDTRYGFCFKGAKEGTVKVMQAADPTAQLMPDYETWYKIEVNVNGNTATARVYNETGILLGSATATYTAKESTLHLEHYGSYKGAHQDTAGITYFDNISVVVND